MKKVSLRISLLVTVLWVSAMIPFLSVQAFDLFPSVKLSSINGVMDLVATVNSYSNELGAFDYLEYSSTSSGGAIVSVDTFSYKELSLDYKQKLMSYTLSLISDSALVAVDKTKLYNFIADTDTNVSAIVRQLTEDSKTDFYKAYSFIKPFSSKLGIVLGVACILLFFGLACSFLLDLAYMTIPTVNALIPAEDGKKPKVISAEAYKAYLAGLNENSKKNVLAVYMKNKWLQIAIVCICILYLASGKIWSLFASIVDLFSGFLS